MCAYIHIYILLALVQLVQRANLAAISSMASHRQKKKGVILKVSWVHSDAPFAVFGPTFSKRVQKGCHLNVLFDVFGSTFSKRVQKERSAAKLEKRPLKKWKSVVFRGVYFEYFSVKTCEKCVPGPPVQHDSVLRVFFMVSGLQKWRLKPIKVAKPWEGRSKSQFGRKMKIWKKSCRRPLLGTLSEAFWRPGGHRSLKKTLFVDALFFSRFLVSKGGGWSHARNTVKWPVAP